MTAKLWQNHFDRQAGSPWTAPQDLADLGSMNRIINEEMGNRYTLQWGPPTAAGAMTSSNIYHVVTANATPSAFIQTGPGAGTTTSYVPWLVAPLIADAVAVEATIYVVTNAAETRLQIRMISSTLINAVDTVEGAWVDLTLAGLPSGTGWDRIEGAYMRRATMEIVPDLDTDRAVALSFELQSNDTVALSAYNFSVVMHTLCLRDKARAAMPNVWR